MPETKKNDFIDEIRLIEAGNHYVLCKKAKKTEKIHVLCPFSIYPDEIRPQKYILFNKLPLV